MLYMPSCERRFLQPSNPLACHTTVDSNHSIASHNIYHTIRCPTLLGSLLYVQHLFHTSSFIELSVTRLRLRLCRCPISVNLKNSDLILKLLLSFVLCVC